MIAAGRLRAQQIAAHRFRRPADLVSWLGAVQAQDPAACLWAVALRLAGRPLRDADIARSLAEGEIVRLHALRGTWQLVAAADVRWILALVGPGLDASFGGRYAQLGLDRTTLRKGRATLTRALSDGAHLTRAELGAALTRGGIAPTGQRLAHLLGHAELAGLICGGIPRGKQATYALLEQRAPGRGATFAGDEARAELARRYFRSRGPATLDDFRWWSGLPAAPARAAHAAIERSLTSRVVAGRTYWHAREAAATRPAPGLHLLPAFDEYLIAYRTRGDVLDPEYSKRLNAGGGMIAPTVVQDGRVIGTWRRALGRTSVAVTVRLFAPAGAHLRPAIAAAVARYGAFLGSSADFTITAN